MMLVDFNEFIKIFMCYNFLNLYLLVKFVNLFRILPFFLNTLFLISKKLLQAYKHQIFYKEIMK